MSRIRLVQIVNDTVSEGVFVNLETSADDVEIAAQSATNTPGQQGEGCNIPDCGAGKWWDSHRMTIVLDKTILSIWKEGPRVFYRFDQTVYPGSGQGTFLWQDNGLPVALSLTTNAPPMMMNP